MRVLITGSRVWLHPRDLWGDLDALLVASRTAAERLTVVHGDALGADRMARIWCGRKGDAVTEERHEVSPLAWRINGPRAGHLRNAHMVKLGAALVLAYCVPCDKPGPCCGLDGARLPDGHATHGTWGCMQLAREAGIEVRERWAA